MELGTLTVANARQADKQSYAGNFNDHQRCYVATHGTSSLSFGGGDM